MIDRKTWITICQQGDQTAKTGLVVTSLSNLTQRLPLIYKLDILHISIIENEEIDVLVFPLIRMIMPKPEIIIGTEKTVVGAPYFHATPTRTTLYPHLSRHSGPYRAMTATPTGTATAPKQQWPPLHSHDLQFQNRQRHFSRCFRSVHIHSPTSAGPKEPTIY